MKTAEGAGTAALLTTVLVWILAEFGVEMPSTVAVALTGVLVTGGAALTAWVHARQRA